jgi:hypothetical protein
LTPPYSPSVAHTSRDTGERKNYKNGKCEMCDPTGISETAVAASIASTAGAEAAAAAGIAASGVAATTTTAAAGAAAGGGLFGGLGTTAGQLGAAASLGSTLLGGIGRSAQYNMQSGLYVQNALNANRALAQTYNANGTRSIQLADQAEQNNFDVSLSMAKAKGTATAAAGEAGVSGVSFANVLSNYEMREGNEVAKTDKNFQWGVAQDDQQNRAAQSRTKAAINETPIPSEAGLYANIGAGALTSGLKIYDIYSNNPKG